MKMPHGWQCLFAALALAVAAASAWGEDASPAELRELLKVSGVEESVRLKASESLAIAREGAAASARTTGRPVDKSSLDRLAATFDPEDLLPKIAAVYGRHFDRQEIQELIAFYRGPVGRKLAASQSSLDQELQEVMGPCGGVMATLSKAAVVATPQGERPVPPTK